MEEKFSDLQSSTKGSSNILFPVLTWYLEFMVAYAPCAAISAVWKFVQKKFDKN